VAPNASTAAYARHIARLQYADGSWQTFDARPPHSDGLFTPTAVAARVISLYLPARADAEKKRRLAAAAKWLATAKPGSTEDLTFRLLGLYWTGGSTKAAAKELASSQRADGGWGQLSAIAESDAYSTGQACMRCGLREACPRQTQVSCVASSGCSASKRRTDRGT
jgi:hypothetical protein